MTLVKQWRTCKNSYEKRHLYYASPEWAGLKEAVRKRSGGKCERCKRNEARDTHHQTYARLYHERLEDLLHVCRPCHEFLSGKNTFDPSMILHIDYELYPHPEPKWEPEEPEEDRLAREYLRWWAEAEKRLVPK